MLCHPTLPCNLNIELQYLYFQQSGNHIYSILDQRVANGGRSTLRLVKLQKATRALGYLATCFVYLGMEAQHYHILLPTQFVHVSLNAGVSMDAAVDVV